MSEKKLKAIIVGPAFPLRGGIANFNEALCRSMNEAAIETEIYSFSLQYPKFLFPGKTQFDNGFAPADLKITTCINSINPLNWFTVAAAIKKQQPDIVIIRYWLPFMGPCLGTIAKLLKKNKNIKIIAITDNIIPHEKRIGDKLFTRYFVKQCSGFIAMSEAVLEDLKKFTDTDKKRFLPHPIYDIFGEKTSKNEARSQLKLSTDGRYLLFFGFIRKYKGLDLLLQAMADERIKKMGVKLIVAGEYYEDSSPYLKLIADNNLQENLILKTNYIPSSDVRYLFCAADMVVQPYRTATQSGVTQIAYHFDKPMLVTNVGGLPEIVPHNRVGYVTSIDAKAIADAIVDFYENKKEQNFAKNVEEEKKRFLWSAFVDGLLDLYRQL
jgi:glycosyltransferase involved in cell wall biosynthesis